MSITTTLNRTEVEESREGSQFTLRLHGQRSSSADGMDACSVCPVQRRPNNDITSIPIEQSTALPPINATPSPPHWLSLRGVPAYNPLNRQMDFSIRPLGANGNERFFLIFMLSGVMIQNWANVAWRKTLGRLNEKWFQFQVGGEW